MVGHRAAMTAALIAILAMVLAGCNVLPSAGADENGGGFGENAADQQGGEENADGEGEQGQGEEGQGEGEEGQGGDQDGDGQGDGEDADANGDGQVDEPEGDIDGDGQNNGDDQDANGDGQNDDQQGDDQGQGGDQGNQPPADEGQGGDQGGNEDQGNQGDNQGGDEGDEPPVDAPGEDPPQENPDPDANMDNVEDETQDPGQDPCDPAGLPEHNGQQTSVRGSAVCNRGAMGVLPAADKTPSIRITSPENGDQIQAGEDISASVAFENFTPGLFDDPQTQYGSRPFSVDGNGNAVGHSHLYIQQLDENNVPSVELDSFLALNDASDNGTLSGDIPAVDEPGRYRLCTDIAGGNHLTFPKGNAQQGPQVDCIQIFVE